MSRVTNDRLAVGKEIVPPLRGLERDIESAVENAGALLSAIARGRLKAKVPFATGLDAIGQISDCLSAILNGAKSIDALHLSLDVIRSESGIPPSAYGDYGDKPAMAPESLAPLRIAS